MKTVKHKEIAPCIYVYENAFVYADEYLKRIKDIHWSNLINVNVGVLGEKNIWPEIYELSDLYSNEYAKQNGVRYEVSDTPHVMHYEKNKGFLYKHADSVLEKRREFSALIYLNNVDDGGETVFTNFNVSISPKSGTLVMFPANYAYMHEASTPKSNDKYSISIWYS
jgi:hypothetical protein